MGFSVTGSRRGCGIERARSLRVAMRVNPQRSDRSQNILCPCRFIDPTVPEHRKVVGKYIVYVSKQAVLEDFDTIESGTDRSHATDNDRTFDTRNHDGDKVAGRHDVADSWDCQ